MSKVLLEKQKKEILESKQTLDLLQQFLKAIHNQGIYKASKFVEKIPFPYTIDAKNLFTMLTKFENATKKVNSLESELTQLKAKLKQTETELQNLRKANNSKILKEVKSNKSSQVNDVVELLKRKRYEQAAQLSSKDLKPIVIDLWEYNLIKQSSNKFKLSNQYKIEPIKTKSSPIYQYIKSIFSNQTDYQLKMQKEFGCVLQNILDAFDDQPRSSQYQFLNDQNKQLIQSIDVYYASLKQQYQKLKQQNREFYNILEVQSEKESKLQHQPQKQQNQQQQFYQLQNQHYQQKQKLKGIDAPHKKQTKPGKSLKKQTKNQKQNSPKGKSKTSKIMSVQATVYINKSNSFIQSTNVNNLEEAQYAIDELTMKNQSLKQRNQQLQRDSKQISQRLKYINLGLINLINIQQAKAFEIHAVNVEKCDTINQNIELIQKEINQLKITIQKLQRIDYKQENSQYEQYQQKIPKSSLKITNPNDSLEPNAKRIYSQNQLSALDKKISGNDSDLDLLRSENEQLKGKCQRLENAIDGSKRDSQNWNAWVVELTEQANSFTTQRQLKNKLIQQLRDEIQQLKESASKQEIKVKKHRKKIDQLQSQIKISKIVYKTQGAFHLNESIQAGYYSVYQQQPKLVDHSTSNKNQKNQKQIERLQAELQYSKKEIQTLRQQIIENNQKINKLKYEKELIDKRILSLEKKQAYNDKRQKQHFEESTNYLNQINSHLALISQLQIQLQKQKIVILEQQQMKRYETVRRQRIKSTVDNGINTSQLLGTHNKLKQAIQNKQKLQKMQAQQRKITAGLERKIIDLQSQKSKCQITIQKLNNDNKQKQKRQDKQIKQLTQRLEEKETHLIQRQQQIVQLRYDLQRKQQQQSISLNHPVKLNPHQQHRFIEHLFTAGQIFDQSTQQRKYLITTLEQKRGQIMRTKLIYKYDNYNKVNIHKYVDYQRQIVVVIRTGLGKLIAGYSQQAFNPNGIVRGDGLLLSLWNQRAYSVVKGKKAITYDDFYLIFGNSEIRLKSLQLLVFSNFGINNAFYQTQGCLTQQWLGEDDRQVVIDSYEVYSLQFAD